MQCPTVRVKGDNEQGFVIINEEDFNSEVHELFEEASEEDAPADLDAPRKKSRR